MKTRFPLFICALLLCAACATQPKKTAPDPHRPVGTIVTVNADQGFVLIDGGPYFLADRGAALKSFSDGKETGVLSVSDQRRPPFVIADIVSGSPQKGDQVMQ